MLPVCMFSQLCLQIFRHNIGGTPCNVRAVFCILFNITRSTEFLMLCHLTDSKQYDHQPNGIFYIIFILFRQCTHQSTFYLKTGVPKRFPVDLCIHILMNMRTAIKPTNQAIVPVFINCAKYLMTAHEEHIIVMIMTSDTTIRCMIMFIFISDMVESSCFIPLLVCFQQVFISVPLLLCKPPIFSLVCV